MWNILSKVFRPLEEKQRRPAEVGGGGSISGSSHAVGPDASVPQQQRRGNLKQEYDDEGAARQQRKDEDTSTLKNRKRSRSQSAEAKRVDSEMEEGRKPLQKGVKRIMTASGRREKSSEGKKQPPRQPPHISASGATVERRISHKNTDDNNTHSKNDGRKRRRVEPSPPPERSVRPMLATVASTTATATATKLTTTKAGKKKTGTTTTSTVKHASNKTSRKIGKVTAAVASTTAGTTTTRLVSQSTTNARRKPMASASKRERADKTMPSVKRKSPPTNPTNTATSIVASAPAAAATNNTTVPEKQREIKVKKEPPQPAVATASLNRWEKKQATTRQLRQARVSVRDGKFNHCLALLRGQVVDAGILVAQALQVGHWPSPFDSNGIRHRTHMSMVGASIQQFCRDTILPSILSATSKDAGDRTSTTAFKAAMIGTCLMLREILIQNSKAIFGRPNYPGKETFQVRTLATAVIMQAIAGEAASTQKRFMEALRDYENGHPMFTQHLKYDTSRNHNAVVAAVAAAAGGDAPKDDQPQGLTMDQESFLRHAERHPLHHPRRRLCAEPNAVHVTVLRHTDAGGMSGDYNTTSTTPPIPNSHTEGAVTQAPDPSLSASSTSISPVPTPTFPPLLLLSQLQIQL